MPSEFGNDVDNVHAVEPAKSVFQLKVKVRRAIEAEGIPYTYVSSNCFAGYFLKGLAQAGLTTPPRDKVVILGDGNAKGLLTVSFDSVYFIHSFCFHFNALFYISSFYNISIWYGDDPCY